MTELRCNRSDWLINVPKLVGFDVMRIFPRDGLTIKAIAEAMAAQGILWERPGQPAYRIIDHGTVIFIQRNEPKSEYVVRPSVARKRAAYRAAQSAKPL